MPDTKIITPGAYDISEEAYHADKLTPVASLSSSGARIILNECPALFWEKRKNPPEPSQALDLGKAAHEWLLEGADWPNHFEVLPEDHNGRTNAGKERIAAIIEAGKRPLKHDELETIKAMHAALVAHPYAHAAFENGSAEKSLYWRDEEFGIWCRCRPDFFPRGHAIVADYKTTRSAAPEYLRKALWDFGYHQQAEWYLSGIKALGLIESPRFLFVFQEKTPPYLVTCVTPSDIALRWADIQNRKAKEIFARCLERGEWPGYADDILTLDLPTWAEYRLNESHQNGVFETVRRAYAPTEAAE